MRDIIENHIAEVRRQLKRIEQQLDAFKAIQSTIGTARLLHVLTDVHLKLVRAAEDERHLLGPLKGPPLNRCPYAPECVNPMQKDALTDNRSVNLLADRSIGHPHDAAGSAGALPGGTASSHRRAQQQHTETRAAAQGHALDSQHGE